YDQFGKIVPQIPKLYFNIVGKTFVNHYFAIVYQGSVNAQPVTGNAIASLDSILMFYKVFIIYQRIYISPFGKGERFKIIIGIDFSVDKLFYGIYAILIGCQVLPVISINTKTNSADGV